VRVFSILGTTSFFYLLRGYIEALKEALHSFLPRTCYAAAAPGYTNGKHISTMAR
jgi:hypothetical protein